MYTQFLRTQDAGPLRGIFYHNTLDIVSLAALQIHIAEMARGECSCAADMIRAGDLWAAKGFQEEARAAWEGALDFRHDRHFALLRLAEAERAAGNYEAAYRYYEESLETERRPVRTLETMAKIEEHRFRRCGDALAHATEALRWLESHRIFKDRQWEEDRKNLLHRIERLKRKTRRQRVRRRCISGRSITAVAATRSGGPQCQALIIFSQKFFSMGMSVVATFHNLSMSVVPY